MAKSKRPNVELVPHPKYGSVSVPSGVTVPEPTIRRGHWRYAFGKIYPESVLVADTSKQNYSVYPRQYYVDVLRECRTCRRPFIFFAREQRHWFETLGFCVDADCVLCSDCRRDSQVIRRRIGRYSRLFKKPDPTKQELMFLVDDGAYLLTRGVLRDLNPLGKLKNMAVRHIPEYQGTRLLIDTLSNARAMQRAL